MTKTILSIAGALALTTPFLTTARKQPQTAIENNNLITPPIENLVIASSTIALIQPAIAEPIVQPIPRPKYNPNYCPRFEVNNTFVSTVESVADVNTPQHCLEPNCGLGVYSRHAGDDVERCSYCNAVRVATGE